MHVWPWKIVTEPIHRWQLNRFARDCKLLHSILCIWLRGLSNIKCSIFSILGIFIFSDLHAVSIQNRACLKVKQVKDYAQVHYYNQ